MYSKRTISLLFLIAATACVAFGQKHLKVDLDKKIADATPAALSQEPVAKRPSTDAKDKNLKDKVHTVTESTIEETGRYQGGADTFNESGNLIKSVDYDDNYPRSVTVWGYLDGKRVSKGNDVIYAPGEKAKLQGMEIIQRLGDPDAPGDKRYDVRREYEYDSTGRLIVETTYGHRNDLFHKITYSYNGSERDQRAQDGRGNEISRTVEVLGKDGNVVEERQYGQKGVASTRVMTYEYDPQGNWIVQKTFNAKDKIRKKPLWTTLRTITYYP